MLIWMLVLNVNVQLKEEDVYRNQMFDFFFLLIYRLLLHILYCCNVEINKFFGKNNKKLKNV